MNSRHEKNSMTRRDFLARAELGIAGACLGLSGVPRLNAAAKDRPNIIFILTDDQRFDAIGCMGNPPWLKTPNLDRLVQQGMLFRNAFCTSSLCAPSRSSFLTGKYCKHTGVVDNFHPLPEKNTIFPQLLQKSGYETAFIGKWHMGDQSGPQPGFDRWVGFTNQGVYMNPPINVDGKESVHPGYMTDILHDYAVQFLRKKREKPFCLYFCHKAVHAFWDPAPRHEKLYEGETYPLPPSSKYNLEGKPNCVKERSVLSKGQTFPPNPQQWQTNTRKYYQCLAAVDESLGNILKTLEETGQRDNTIIVFASDNGQFLGEHGLMDKRFAYEASIRIPFIVWYPRMIKAGSVSDEFVLNIDYAPTMLDLAGVPIPRDMQGRSLRPLLEGKSTKWRNDFLYHYHVEFDVTRMTPEQREAYFKQWGAQGGSIQSTPENVAVRDKEWKYITYPGINEVEELYNLAQDPHEMNNLAYNPKYADVVRRMKARLAQLQEEYER